MAIGRLRQSLGRKRQLSGTKKPALGGQGTLLTLGELAIKAGWAIAIEGLSEGIAVLRPVNANVNIL